MKGDEMKGGSSLGQDIHNLRDSLQDKGWQYFQRPIALGLLLSLSCYWFLFTAPVRRLRDIETELEATRATAKYASSYKDLKERLGILYSMLPRSKDPEGWLTNSIRETLRQEDLVPTSFSQVRSARTEGYRFISITVNCDGSYKQLASWIARLERSETLLFIESYKLIKKKEAIGINSAEVTVTTAVPEIPLEGGTGGPG